MSVYIPGPGPSTGEAWEDIGVYRRLYGRISRYLSPIIFFFRIGAVSELGAREFIRRYRRYYFSLLTRLMLTKWLSFSPGTQYASNWSDGETVTVEGITYYLRKGYVKFTSPREVVAEAVWAEPSYDRNRLEALGTNLSDSWAPKLTEGSPYVYRRVSTETDPNLGEIHVVEFVPELSRVMTYGTLTADGHIQSYGLYETQYSSNVRPVFENLDKRIIIDDNQAEAYAKAGILSPNDLFVTESGYDPFTGWWMPPEERFQKLFDIVRQYIWTEDKSQGMWAVVREWFNNATNSLKNYFVSVGYSSGRAEYLARRTAGFIYNLVKFQAWVDRSFEGPSGWFNRLVFELTRNIHWFEPLAVALRIPMSLEMKWTLVVEIPTLRPLLGLTDEWWNNPEENPHLREEGVEVVEGHLIPALPERITREKTKIYIPLKNESGEYIVLTEGQEVTIELEGQQVTAIYHKGKIRWAPPYAKGTVEEDVGFFEVPAPNPYYSDKPVYIIHGYVCVKENITETGAFGTVSEVEAYVPIVDENGNPVFAGYVPLKWFSFGDVYEPVTDPDTNQPLDVTNYIGQLLQPPKIDEYLYVSKENVTLELQDGTELTGTYILLKLVGSEQQDLVRKYAYITVTYTDPDTGEEKTIAHMFFYDEYEDKWVDTGTVANYKVVNNVLYKLVPDGGEVYYLAKLVTMDMYYWNQGILLTWHIYNFLHFIYGLFMMICEGDVRELLTLLIMVYSGSSAEDLNRLFGTKFSELDWQQVGQLLDVFGDVVEFAARLLIRWRRRRVMYNLIRNRVQSMAELAKRLRELRNLHFESLIRVPGGLVPDPMQQRRIRYLYLDVSRRVFEELRWLGYYDPTHGRFPYTTALVQFGIWQLFNFASALQVIAKDRQQYYDQLLEQQGWITAHEAWMAEQYNMARQYWRGVFSFLASLFTWTFSIIFWALPMILAVGIATLVYAWARRSNYARYIIDRLFRIRFYRRLR